MKSRSSSWFAHECKKLFHRLLWKRGRCLQLFKQRTWEAARVYKPFQHRMSPMLHSLSGAAKCPTATNLSILANLKSYPYSTHARTGFIYAGATRVPQSQAATLNNFTSWLLKKTYATCLLSIMHAAEMQIRLQTSFPDLRHEVREQPSIYHPAFRHSGGEWGGAYITQWERFLNSFMEP